jgi:hypothetical protein
MKVEKRFFPHGLQAVFVGPRFFFRALSAWFNRSYLLEAAHLSKLKQGGTGQLA